MLTYDGYDWRMSLMDSVEKLDTFINDKAQGKKVFLVAHSMGGLLARAYVADKGRAAKIAGVVTVGTPYLGAPLMAKVMASGKPGTHGDFLLNSSQIKGIIHNSPGIQELLPTETYFSGRKSPYYVLDPGRTLSSYRDTMAHFVRRDYLSTNTLNIAEDFHNKLDGFDRNFYLDNGKYTALYSVASKTPLTIVEKQQCHLLWPWPCIEAGKWTDGDGTVPLGSSDLRWMSHDQRNRVEFCGYPKAPDGKQQFKQHADLFLDKSVIADVLTILRGKAPENCHADTNGPTAAAADGGFREYTVLGDEQVQVQVVDEQGERHGRRPGRDCGEQPTRRDIHADRGWRNSHHAIWCELPTRGSPD